MPHFPLWLPAGIALVNCVLATASLLLVRRSLSYARQAAESRRQAEAALARTMEIVSRARPPGAPHDGDADRAE